MFNSPDNVDVWWSKAGTLDGIEFRYDVGVTSPKNMPGSNYACCRI